MNMTWMIGTILFGALLAVAAAVADRAVAAAGWPRRAVWGFALAAATLWPLGAGAIALWRAARPAVTAAPAVLSVTQVIATRITATPAWRVQPSGVLTALWMTVSLLLLARVAIGLVRVRRLVHAAAPAEVDGVAVWVTQALGPAVCGVLHPRIVVPQWFFDLDQSLRAVVLEHETEHTRRGDAGAVLAGTLATVLLPWSPAVWWMARRLRLAVELDCDARVLRQLRDRGAPKRYSQLLLLVAQRQSVARLLPMLAESNAHLERRIAVMHAPTRTTSRTRVAALGAAAVAVTLFACSSRVTGDLTAPQTMSASRAAGIAPTTQGDRMFFDFQVDKPVTVVADSPMPRYPDILNSAGIEGEVLTQFVVGTDGTMVPGSAKILKSTHPLFTAAVRQVLPDMRFTPAEVGGKRVRQLVQYPFVFQVATSDQAPARSDRVTIRPSEVHKLAPTVIKPQP